MAESSLTGAKDEYRIGDPILHIELRRWADIVLVAPCSANTLSKIAHGLCDNLAVSVFMEVLNERLRFDIGILGRRLCCEPLLQRHRHTFFQR